MTFKDAKTGEIRGEKIFDTVLCAVGRNADSEKLGAKEIGIKVYENGKILANEDDTTSVPNIFAIGDVCHGRLELTPVNFKKKIINNYKILIFIDLFIFFFNTNTYIFYKLF